MTVAIRNGIHEHPATNTGPSRTASGHFDDMPGTGTDLLGRLRILLVEDTWHVAHAMKSLLEMDGMDVLGPTATIAEARLLLVESGPDLALVDLNLGGEMAYGLIDQLYEWQVPVIIVSGYLVQPSYQGKIAAIMSKPIRAGNLFTVIRSIAAKH